MVVSNWFQASGFLLSAAQGEDLKLEITNIYYQDEQEEEATGTMPRSPSPEELSGLAALPTLFQHRDEREVNKWLHGKVSGREKPKGQDSEEADRR